MSHRACEIFWLKILLKELGFDYNDSMRLYCDNNAAINIAHSPVQHDRTKHDEIDCLLKKNLEQVYFARCM